MSLSWNSDQSVVSNTVSASSFVSSFHSNVSVESFEEKFYIGDGVANVCNGNIDIHKHDVNAGINIFFRINSFTFLFLF